MFGCNNSSTRSLTAWSCSIDCRGFYFASFSISSSTR